VTKASDTVHLTFPTVAVCPTVYSTSRFGRIPLLPRFYFSMRGRAASTSFHPPQGSVQPRVM
jgi:hypothetical protein